MKYTIDSLIQQSLKYKDENHDLDNALKYAMLAAALSYQPRADACCCIGEIYLSKGNDSWAKFWFEKALNNMSVWIDEQLPDSEYFTIIPLLKLCFIAHREGDDKAAKEYNDAVLAIDSKNEIALSNKKEFGYIEAKAEV
jgi:hypothetical protein